MPLLASMATRQEKALEIPQFRHWKAESPKQQTSSQVIVMLVRYQNTGDLCCFLTQSYDDEYVFLLFLKGMSICRMIYKTQSARRKPYSRYKLCMDLMMFRPLQLCIFRITVTIELRQRRRRKRQDKWP